MQTDAVHSLLIFDCDGVLVDSEPLSCQILAETLTRHGVPADIPYVVQHFLGRQLGTVRAHAQARQVQLPADFEHELNTRLLQRLRTELRPTPHTREVLARLDIPTCVASSSHLERVRLSLEVTGLTPFLGERLYTAEMVARGKPEPDLFLHAAQRMGADPAACLVIEDSPYGILAARAAGMQAWGFVGGSHHHDRAGATQILREAGAHRVIDDMRTLSP